MSKRIFLLVILISALSLACMVSTSGIRALQSGSVLFKDDFSSPTSGWDREREDDYLMDYADDSYRIFIAAEDVTVWSSPGLVFDDVVVEVDASRLEGPNDNNFGLICRSDNEIGSFYFFSISSDGYYTIGKVKGGEQVLLADEVMQTSEVVRKGSAKNHLRAECVGDRLSFYVNGARIVEVYDSEFISGNVGLTAGSFETPGVYISFDNFLVLSP